MVDSCSKIGPLAPVSEVSFFCPVFGWTEARRRAAAYFHRVNGFALPDFFPDELVQALRDDSAESTRAALLSSASVHPDHIRPEVAE